MGPQDQKSAGRNAPGPRADEQLLRRLRRKERSTARASPSRERSTGCAPRPPLRRLRRRRRRVSKSLAGKRASIWSESEALVTYTANECATSNGSKGVGRATCA